MSDNPGPVNIGNPDELTVLSIAERIITLAASGSHLEFVPLPVDDPQRRCPDISRAREVLGWAPIVTLPYTRRPTRRSVPWRGGNLRFGEAA
jgi:dTDP-glucose 4,6-dehydratase